jgi:hypothetical protein
MSNDQEDTCDFVCKLDTQLGYKPANLIVPVILFALLVPGFLFTFPAGTSGKIWRSGEVTWQSVLLHAVIFMIILYGFRKTFAEKF